MNTEHKPTKARLRIKNWEKFQHYQTGRNAQATPPWIKVHTKMIDDFDFMSMSAERRGQLILLWILASKDGGFIPNDARYLRKRLQCNVDLSFFLENGWVESYDDPRMILGSSYESPRPEEEEEEEEEKTPNPPAAIATAEHTPLKAEPKPDPLLSYPRLTGSYTRIREKLVEIHPKAKLPALRTAKEWADRNTLAQLVRIDGYTEAEVLETLKWIFTGESRDAEFWRSQFRSVSWLRKTSDGATRFTKAHDLRIKEEGKAEASTIDPLTQQLLDQIDGRAA